jgi:hypothetical protein
MRLGGPNGCMRACPMLLTTLFLQAQHTNSRRTHTIRIKVPAEKCQLDAYKPPPTLPL